MRALIPATVLISVFVLPASALAARGRPYSNLFTGQMHQQPNPPAQAIRFAPPQAPPSAGAATIVCGMTVVEGDSSIDRTIVHRAPAHAPTALITMIPPKGCKR